MAMFVLQTAPTLPTVSLIMAGFHRARDTKRFPISSMLAGEIQLLPDRRVEDLVAVLWIVNASLR
jgi:hypothetical protein